MNKPTMIRPTNEQAAEYKAACSADYDAADPNRLDMFAYPAPRTEAWIAANPEVHAAILAWKDFDAAGSDSFE